MIRNRARRRFFEVLVVILTALPHYQAYADSPISDAPELSTIKGWQAKWTKCEKADDCQLILFGPGCYWQAAINRSWLKEAQAFLIKTYFTGKTYPPEECSPSFVDRLTSSPKCIEGTCGL